MTYAVRTGAAQDMSGSARTVSTVPIGTVPTPAVRSRTPGWRTYRSAPTRSVYRVACWRTPAHIPSSNKINMTASPTPTTLATRRLRSAIRFRRARGTRPAPEAAHTDREEGGRTSPTASAGRHLVDRRVRIAGTSSRLPGRAADKALRTLHTWEGYVARDHGPGPARPSTQLDRRPAIRAPARRTARAPSSGS